ncbi:MAG: glycosyltransferase family 2 protein [bacterium]
MFKNYFYNLLAQYCMFFFKRNAKVVELNPRTTFLFTKLKKKQEKKNEFNIQIVNQTTDIIKDTYDVVINNGNVHYDDDIQKSLKELKLRIKPETRVIICFYNALWRPWIRLARFFRISRSDAQVHWVSPVDMENFARLSGYEIVYKQQRILFPIYIPLISFFLNKILAPLPFFRLFTMVNIVILRSLKFETSLVEKPSVSVVVAARNEEGNIEDIIKRVPKMGYDDELIIVEGNSTDNTWEEMKRIKDAYHTTNIIIAQQKGKGKGDAIREGFKLAKKEILMILDADLTVPPEDLPKFYNAIIENKGEFINGSRLVYSMENHAMRFFNIIGNKFFAIAFSFVLSQKLKDTLCGTKVLTRKNYLEIAANRKYFGDFDPFGDFDLIFGAAKLGLKIIEVPIRYRARTYGDTNIQRWKHGLILFRMLLFASRKIKFI